MNTLKTGLGITALVFGAVSLLMSFIPGLNVLGFFVALTAVILGIVALASRNQKTALGVIGGALGIVAIFMGLLVNIVFFAATSDSSTDAATETVAAAPAKQEPAKAEKTEKAEPVKEAKAEPAKVEKKAEAPKETSGQKNALRAAENYVGILPMSKEALVTQLEFEDYSKADAKWAASHVDVDWNENAVKAAESYNDLMPMSHSGMVTQLKFDGYTSAQAEHGATGAGL